MALITVNLRLVSPYGENDIAKPASGQVRFTPISHGKLNGALRAIETVNASIIKGVMSPVELTPGAWTVEVLPIRGNPWPAVTVTLEEGMEEPVNLADLAPEIVIKGEQLAKGDPGPTIASWEDNEDGTIKFLLSDGTYTDSGTMPRGPQGPVGDQGPVGPAGPQGVEGPKGDQGVQGPVGPAGMTWRGVWDPEDDYVNDDSVYHEGSSWFAAGDPTPGEEPSTDSTHWHALAMQGAQGIQGEQGIQGPEGPQGPVGLTGPAPELVWDGTSLIIDDGEPVDLKGEKGDGSSWAELTGKPATYPSTIPEVDGLQAALPRIDTTAGTRVFTGDVMIHGKTGWRDLTPYLAADVTPSSNLPDARFRRVNDTIEFAMKVDLGGGFDGSVVAAFPAGFQTSRYQYLPGAYIGSGTGAGASSMNPVEMIGYVQDGNLQTPLSRKIPANSTLIWSGSFVTTDPWPTTLPGIPA